MRVPATAVCLIFVRYIENLQKYEVDFGEASTIGEEENTVRIMSIHKSKGLEFPVVFVAGLGKAFNRQDARSTIAIHQNYGVGCDVVDPLLRTKAPTILKKAIQQILLTESLGGRTASPLCGGDTCKRKALFERKSQKNGRYALKMERRGRKKAAVLSGDQKCRIDARMDSAFCAL